MKEIALVSCLVSALWAVASAQRLHETDNLLQRVEDHTKNNKDRADAVDMLVKMSVKNAGPRLLAVLLGSASFDDTLDHRILVYFQEFPSAEAVHGLLAYEEIAMQMNIEMPGKIRTNFRIALNACKMKLKMD